ncbi:MAG: hypothetical protein KC543_16220 [Myxococcales bacterium]|nr:hypothetical protein [Myxococcales bacterium]
MLRLATIAAAGVTALTLLSGNACNPDPPGEPAGTYAVQGTLVENTCGPGVAAVPDPLSFNAELRVDPDGPVYWRRAGRPIVTGVAKGNAYQFQSRGSYPISGVEQCTLSENNDLTFTVEGAEAADRDAGAGAGTTLSGKLVTLFAASSGSDCRRLLAVNGGPWLALPCQVTYTLDGKPTSGF